MVELKEGALLGNTLLSEDDFKSVLRDLLKNSEYEIRVRNILNDIKNNENNSKRIFDDIEELQTELFKNPSVSLMVIGDLNDSQGNYKMYWSEKEELYDNGYVKYTNTIKNDKLEDEITKAVSQHFLNLIKYVEKPVPNNFNDYFNNGKLKLTKHNKSSMGARLANRKVPQADKTYLYIFYGSKANSKEGDSRYQLLADSFLNHLGNLHRDLFGGNFNFRKIEFKDDVWEEEKENFYQMLANATNSTGWYTGGDLIIIENNKIIANIQLKTILKLSGKYSGTKIKTDKVVNSVNKILEIMDSKREQAIDHFYTLFKTSAFVHTTEEKLKMIPITYARQRLGNIKSNIEDKNIKITWSN